MVITILLLLSSQAFSDGETGGLCRSMAAFTCAPGQYDDGTGPATTMDNFTETISTLKENAKKDFKAKFKDILADPSHKTFRKLAAEACGLSNAPHCVSNEAKDKSKCLDDLSDWVSRLALKKVFWDPSTRSKYGAPKISDVDFVIGQPIFKNAVKELFKTVEAKVSDPPTVERIHKMFPKVQAAMAKKIAQYVDEPDRQKLIDKVNAIDWGGTSCYEEMTERQGGSVVAPLLMPNAFYNGPGNSFRICNGIYFSNKSEFQIVQTMVHELTHAIGPCGSGMWPGDMAIKYPRDATRRQVEDRFPFKNVLSCLRESDSIQAQWKVPAPKTAGGMGGGTIPPAGPPMPPVGGGYMGEIPFRNFCMRSGDDEKDPVDQIEESFADWLAAEVVPEYMDEHHKGLTASQFRYGYGNIFKTNCPFREDEKADREDPYYLPRHPYTDDRIDRILLVNPKIRAQMKCSTTHEEYRYCEVKKEKPKPDEAKKPDGVVR
jgi:hypothetical protein